MSRDGVQSMMTRIRAQYMSRVRAHIVTRIRAQCMSKVQSVARIRDLCVAGIVAQPVTRIRA